MSILRKVAGLALLQQNNNKNQMQHTKVEMDFLNHFYNTFKKEFPHATLVYNILKDKTLEFKVNNHLVGTIKLQGNKKGMQLHTSESKWFSIQEKEDYFVAKEKIVEWIEFSRGMVQNEIIG